ncbi:hypothetical protein [Brachyspira aalborgi]|uniref:Uncharacterized protein n=1 Tax=Brachyspira aalborgi TaxID=29522 RepID=A0A5C8FKB6_9SPIR|nr:hypothetical protein [Brachyspira aalborgi]TXJ49120.1 hypothetical protein EPJ84_09075 [Brachyspira aalborgi]
MRMRKISYLLIYLIFTYMLYAQEEQVASGNPLISIGMMIVIFVIFGFLFRYVIKLIKAIIDYLNRH